MKGAPIRFVAAAIGGWVCVRIAVLLPGVERLELAGGMIAPPAAAVGRTPTVMAGDVAIPMLQTARIWPLSRTSQRRVAARAATANPLPATSAATAMTPMAQNDVQSGSAKPGPIIVPVSIGPASIVTPTSRWAASAWSLARGGANGTVSGGRLGASQTGVRVTYLLDPRHKIALAGRIATPLRGRGTEAAIGLDWQPTAAPIHLVVEQRIAVDGARGGPTAMVIAGLNPTPIAAGFRLEAYAQGGAILRNGRAEAFGDGAARLTRPIASLGATTLDLGVGTWAAGQAGVVRGDVGPTLGISVPVARQRLRVSLDWRQRVAGRARPGSGPALSIGSDF